MYGPRALVSMLTVLLVFAVATYLLNGSFATTLWQTLLCALILQAGYFVAVLFLIRKEAAERNRDLADTTALSRSADDRLKDEIHASPVSKLNIGDR
jgi:exopolysaccharide production repressor protein